MQFGQFPLDTHNCYFLLTSCRYLSFSPEHFYFSFLPTVGYDQSKMILEGEFLYDKENQRTLPFNVDISELPQLMRVYRGTSST